MARIGLGKRWRCVFANEWSTKKASAYREHFHPPNDEFIEADIASLLPRDLPPKPMLSWASFPCQDLSLAGNYAGLDGHRSGTFKTYWQLMNSLIPSGRAPEVVVLENVVGTLTSHKGKDFEFLIDQLRRSGYAAGALVMDAVHFLPQSRPRLFVIGVRANPAVLAGLVQGGPSEPWHPKTLVAAHSRLTKESKDSWCWWRLPTPSIAPTPLESLLEDDPTDAPWHSDAETKKLR